MEDFSLGDLYDDQARELSNHNICKQSIYECRFCPNFVITGSDLMETNVGQVHAASHRIAFEALAEPTVFLNCPICNIPQCSKEARDAIVFDCMFNDLDLVKHLEAEHVDMLLEDMLGDFNQTPYLLTTFKLKRSAPIFCPETVEQQLETSYYFPHSNNDRNLSDGNIDPQSDNIGVSPSNISMEDNESNDVTEAVEAQPHNSPIVTSEPSLPMNDVVDDTSPVDHVHTPTSSAVMLDANYEVSFNANKCEVAVECDTNIPPFEPISMPCSRVTCMDCCWEAVWCSDALEFRKSIASHIRFHIRLESEKRLNDPNVFYAAKRLLCCMDFSLEEYFEKETLTDLSNTVNAQLMEKTYLEILVKLFGVSYPLVMRILHGMRGNPFRKSVKKRRRPMPTLSILQPTKQEIVLLDEETSDDGNSKHSTRNQVLDETDGDDTENLDATTNCSRPECGNSILTGDARSLARHIAAHIRHDENRLQTICTPLVCQCGMNLYSPSGFVYHVFRDHTFEKNTFDNAAKTFMSYLNLLFESMLKSCTAHMDQEAAQRAWGWKSGIPNWRAYFSLESDEGEETMWSDCSTVNGAWLNLWNYFIEEDTHENTLRIGNLSMGDVFKLMEMHPFVEFLDPPARTGRIYLGSDDKAIIRSVSSSWRLLGQWLNGTESEKTQLAPMNRWNYLQDRKKKLFRVNRQSLYGHVQPSTFSQIVSGQKHLESILVRRSPDSNFPSTSNGDSTSGQLCTAESGLSSLLQADRLTKSIMVNTGSVVGPSSPGNPSEGIALEIDISPSHDGEMAAIEIASCSTIQKLHCRYCKGSNFLSNDESSLKMHSAKHLISEMRCLCSLYIHRHSEKPLTCPFCNWEIPVYRPLQFMSHLDNHRQEVLKLYDSVLCDLAPKTELFDVTPQLEENANIDTPSSYVIRCQRYDKCCWDEVLSLPVGHNMSVQDVDVTILKHILWHVRNDDEMDLSEQERDLLTKTIMSRLSGGNSVARQIIFAARKALKHFWPNLLYRETEVLKFIMDKINWMGQKLFGPNKGLVFLMAFPRRWVREQCGSELFPTCACSICRDKELPKYSADRRKRVFVAYTHPVTCHALEHLSAGEIETTDDMECSCPLDKITFAKISVAVKHILDNHNSVVEVNGLPIILQTMGIMDLFGSVLDNVFQDQAWQLKQALGFDVTTMIDVPQATFFVPIAEHEEFLRGHLSDCPRRQDLTLTECNCINPSIVRPAVSTDGLPQQSMQFYREFLQVENPNDDHLVNEDLNEESGSDDEETQEVDEAPTNESTPVVKQEIAEPLAENDQNQTEDVVRPSRAANSRILRKLKALKKETAPPLERNIALPFKNVIQGSRTVAAAVAAALGTDADLGQRKRSPTRTIIPSVHVSNAVPSVSSKADKRETPANDEAMYDNEESDLALGSFSKRTRISTGISTADSMVPVRKRLKRNFKGLSESADALGTNHNPD